MRTLSALSVFLLVCISSLVVAEEIKFKKILKQDWLELRSQNFTIITDAKLKKAKAAIQTLEDYRHLIAYVVGEEMLSDTKPLLILAPSKARTFDAMGLPENWAGLMLKTLEGSFAVANLDNFNTAARRSGAGNQVLLHEYVHYAMHSLVNPKSYPFWYSEGLAEYFATYRLNRDGQISIGNVSELRWRFYELRSRKGPRFEKIDVEGLFKTRNPRMNWEDEEDSSERRKGHRGISKLYARSTAVPHYLHADFERDKQLKRYIFLINQGLDVDDAFDISFDMTYEEMDDAIIEYISGRQLIGRVYDRQKIGTMSDAQIEHRALNDADVLFYLHKTLAALDATELEEKQEIFKRLQEARPDLEDAIATEAWRRYDLASPQLDNDTATFIHNAIDQFPDNAALIALEASLTFQDARARLLFGEDQSDALKRARFGFRRAIQKDPLFGRAYHDLGLMAQYSPHQSSTLDKEAIACLDSARILGNDHQSAFLAFRQALLLLKIDFPEQALISLRHASAASGSYWMQAYAFFIHQALELQHIHLYQATKTEDGLKFGYRAVWRGDVKQGLPDGPGTLTLLNGSTAEGTWRRGLLEGRGRFSVSNGYVYEGNFQAGAITGLGRLYYPESHRVEYSEGHFLNAMEHGEHTFVYREGMTSKSEYVATMSYGPAQITLTDGQDHEVFTFRGQSSVTLDDGTEYSGPTLNLVIGNGKGVCRDAKSGEIFICEAQNGILQDRHELTFSLDQSAATASIE